MPIARFDSLTWHNLQISLRISIMSIASFGSLTWYNLQISLIICVVSIARFDSLTWYYLQIYLLCHQTVAAGKITAKDLFQRK